MQVASNIKSSLKESREENSEAEFMLQINYILLTCRCPKNEKGEKLKQDFTPSGSLDSEKFLRHKCTK